MTYISMVSCGDTDAKRISWFIRGYSRHGGLLDNRGVIQRSQGEVFTHPIPCPPAYLPASPS
jgi:hypothetical protein